MGYYGNVIKALKVKKGLKYLAKIPSDKGSEGKKKKPLHLPLKKPAVSTRYQANRCPDWTHNAVEARSGRIGCHDCENPGLERG